MKPLVSVIIPTYNRAAVMSKALDSVLAQEGVGELFEMEVIVVDDASSDDTAGIVRSYPGVRYIRLETNQGECGARNAGIQASRGTYVGFLDDDDEWLSHKLSVQVPALESRPEVGLVYGQSIVIDNGVPSLRPNARSAASGNVFRALLMREFMSVNTPLVRREAFQVAGYFDESLPRAGMPHYDMFLRLAFHFPFVFVPGAVAVGRVNEDGLFFSHLGGENGYLRAAPFVVEKALTMLEGADDYPKIRREVLASLVHRMFHWLGRIKGTEPMRANLFAALKTYPWIVTDPSVKVPAVRGIARVASALARASTSPIETVRGFLAEVKSITGQRGLRDRLRMQRVLAGVWTEVAVSLRSDPVRRYRAAGYAAACAIFHDPSQLLSRPVLNSLLRAVFSGSRWDPIFGQLKTNWQNRHS